MDTYNSKKVPFSGVATALCTPFSEGEIDFDAFSRLVEWQINMGVDAICVAGTTGEAATLSRTERKRLLSAAKEKAAGRVPVVVGCGSASTESACTFCRDAAYLGADALLVITPYCNKGTRQGVLEHYRRVADAANGLPVILYNVPSRTGVDLDFSIYKELDGVGNIAAVKEASANFTRMTRLVGESGLALYSGNDDMILPVLSVGGKGVISVLSNILPAETAALTRAALGGDYVTAAKLAHRYAHLIELLFVETNPAPVKYAMQLLELCSGEMRLPLSEVCEDTKKKIKAEMKKLAII